MSSFQLLLVSKSPFTFLSAILVDNPTETRLLWLTTGPSDAPAYASRTNPPQKHLGPCCGGFRPAAHLSPGHRREGFGEDVTSPADAAERALATVRP